MLNFFDRKKSLKFHKFENHNFRFFLVNEQHFFPFRTKFDVTDLQKVNENEQVVNPKLDFFDTHTDFDVMDLQKINEKRLTNGLVM